MDIGDLPDEVLVLILGLLNVTDVPRVALVCARWAEQLRGQRVWCWLFLREQCRRAEPRSRNAESRSSLSEVAVTLDSKYGADLASLANYGASCWRELYRDTFICRFDAVHSDDELEKVGPFVFEALPPATTKVTLCKLLMVGDSDVGKTSFRRRFCNEKTFDFTGPTSELDFDQERVLTRNARLCGEHVKVMLWDTPGPGQEMRIGPRTSAHYRGAHGIFVMFDTGKRRTFETARRYLAEVQRLAPLECCLLLVGMKADDLSGPRALPPNAYALAPESLREVSTAEGKAAAVATTSPSGSPVQYVECSSRTGVGIEQVVCRLTRDVIASRARSDNVHPIKLTPQHGVARQPASRSSCCVQ